MLSAATLLLLLTLAQSSAVLMVSETPTLVAKGKVLFLHPKNASNLRRGKERVKALFTLPRSKSDSDWIFVGFAV